MEYKVGQIIFLLDDTRNAVLPARVYEQVTKKTIEGEEEFFYVEVPGSKELLNLSDFEGLVFEDSEKVKSHLFETLKANIDSLVEKANKEAVDRWGDIVPTKPEKKSRRGRPKKKVEPEINQEPEPTLVDLGDGRVARLKQ